MLWRYSIILNIGFFSSGYGGNKIGQELAKNIPENFTFLPCQSDFVTCADCVRFVQVEGIPDKCSSNAMAMSTFKNFIEFYFVTKLACWKFDELASAKAENNLDI